MIVFRCVCVLLTVLIPLSVRADEPVNLLQNPSFEETEKDAGGKDQPVHWKVDGEIEGVTYSWTKTSGVENSGAVQIKKTVNKFFPIAQWTQSFEYDGKSPVVTLSTQVKTKNARKAILDIQFIDENGEWLSHEWVAYIGQKEPRDKPSTHNWKTYTGSAKVPANTKTIIIGLQDYGPGEIWFDNVKAVYSVELPKQPNNVPQ